MLLDHARRLCRDRELAEDLAQDAWIKAYRAIDQLDPNLNPKSWLMRILQRCYLDHKRYQQCRIHGHCVSFDHPVYGEDHDLTWEPLDEINWETAILDDVQQQTDYARAQKLVDDAFKPEEVSMLMDHMAEVPYKEIAERCPNGPINIGTVRSRLFRIRKRLQEISIDNDDAAVAV